MTVNDKEKVLKYMCDACKKSKSLDSINTKDIYSHFSAIPFLDQILKKLEDDDLIVANWVSGKVWDISITPNGLIYFDEKRQSKIDYWKKFAASHFINLAVSAIVAFITALLTVKLSGK